MTVEKDFPRPPGGKLICDDGQTAVIRIKDKVITASCSTPPSGIRISIRGDYTNEFKKWVIAIVQDKDFERYKPLTSDENRIFAAREFKYIDMDGIEVIVTFVPSAANERPEDGGQMMEM